MKIEIFLDSKENILTVVVRCGDEIPGGYFLDAGRLASEEIKNIYISLYYFFSYRKDP
jgi:hypothetical protein